MTDVITVSERKARANNAAQAAATRLMAELKDYAEATGGRFLVFGSAATGMLRSDSDFDLMLDFPPALEAAAWMFAEESCRAHGLKGDVLSASRSPVAFVTRVRAQAVLLG